MEITQQNHQPTLIATLTLVSWLGEVVHNAFELPQLTLLGPENSLPGLFSLLLFMGWWKQPRGRKVWRWLLIGWAAFHLIGGGILSVIPFSFLPFYPEQSLQHYLAHVIYSVTQLPLIWVLWRSSP
jgi:hypothetical protein